LEITDKNLKIKRLKILEAEEIQICPGDSLQCNALAKPGQITGIVKKIGFVIRCVKGFLLVKSVQPASKNVMSAWSFLQGQNLKIGDKLS
jgi:methionyl-tRNA formyltransferase